MNRNWLEWTILAVSAAIVVVLVGYLVTTGLSSSGPALIQAAVVPEEATDGPDGGWLVPLVVRNAGGTAAVSIVIEGSATIDGVDEASQVTIDLLAADSEVVLVLGYSARPDDEVSVRVVGFETP